MQDAPERMNETGTCTETNAKSRLERSGFDPIEARRNLIAKRVAAGADTEIGHRCSNLVELLDNYASASVCENSPAQARLEVLIRKQMADLAIRHQ